MGIEEVEAALLAYAKDYDPLRSHTLTGPMDPFLGSAQQTHRMRAYCVVIVGGVDITNRIAPFLISVRIQDGNQHTCEIEMDDRDALMPIPPIGAEVVVLLGWTRGEMIKTFDGVIDSVEHGFGRKQGGRRMWIHANGLNQLKSRMKEPMQMNLGVGAPPGQKEGEKIGLNQWIQKLATAGGGSAEVAGKFAANMQDYWGAMGASPMHQIVQEGLKAGAMVQGTTGNVWKFEDPGQRGVSCFAIWRENLIGYRVRPFASRTTWEASQSESFDKNAGEHIKKIMGSLTKGMGPAEAAGAAGGGAAPQGSASGVDNANQGAADEQGSTNMGAGRIVINGEPKATFNSMCQLQGVRPGVDGTYLIQVAEHIYSRQGYVTWLDVTPHAKAPDASNVFKTWPLPRPNPNQ